MTQLIVLSFALFTAAAIAVSFYLNSKLVKFISIALIVVLANMTYFTFDGVKGWPAEENKNIKGILTAVTILNPSENDPGAIFISLYPTTPKKWYEYEYYRRAPRTFHIKYSNNRAAKFEQAKKALKEGQEVRINGIPPENSSDNDGSGEGIVGNIISQFEKFLSTQKDTYKPNVPDIEIIKITPPQKGKTQ